jgi:CxxC motif-containing protein
MSEAVGLERLTCLLCPEGCELEVRRQGDEASVEGHRCDQGLVFAEEEVLHPLRNLAVSVPVRGSRATMVSVRLSARIPRKMIFPVLAEISRLRPEAPVRRGQVLIADVLHTGADVVATRTVDPLSSSGPPGARGSRPDRD